MQPSVAYTELYNQMAGSVHSNICDEHGLEVPGSKWETPPKVVDNINVNKSIKHYNTVLIWQQFLFSFSHSLLTKMSFLVIFSYLKHLSFSPVLEMFFTPSGLISVYAASWCNMSWTACNGLNPLWYTKWLNLSLSLYFQWAIVVFIHVCAYRMFIAVLYKYPHGFGHLYLLEQ